MEHTSRSIPLSYLLYLICFCRGCGEPHPCRERASDKPKENQHEIFIDCGTVVHIYSHEDNPNNEKTGWEYEILNVDGIRTKAFDPYNPSFSPDQIIEEIEKK